MGLFFENADFNFKEGELTLARNLLEMERIVPLNRENLFRKTIYWFLSSSEKHEKQQAIFKKLNYYKFTSPERILNDRTGLCNKILGESRFPNQKKKWLISLCNYWIDSNFVNELFEDVNSKKEKGFELRENISKYPGNGIGRKCASSILISCGYDNLVPVDVWVLRYLNDYDEGLGVKLPDYKVESGPTKKEYLKYEEYIVDKGTELGVTPAELQAMIWIKGSGNESYKTE